MASDHNGVDQSQQDGQGFATAAEAARFLRLSKAMIHKLIGERKIPACRFGRAVRIPWSWLRARAGE
jgi:excisionase family DNA binding protein